MSKKYKPALNELTLFTLHDCLNDAFTEVSHCPLPAPMLGKPAELSADSEAVSDAMFDSVDTDRAKSDGVHKMTSEAMTASFMIERRDKALLDKICAENGTTASGFLRACARRLIAEYSGND